MIKRRVRVVFLCEDKQQEYFLRHFFVEMGWPKRELYFETGPSGKGAASGWVIQNFPTQLQAYRQRKNKAASALVVMVDADTRSVGYRIKELESSCEQGISFRGPEEAVAIAVPKRNIETWIAFLKGDNVDETQNYKPQGNKEESECRPFVSNLAGYCKKQVLPTNAPASLHAACKEYRDRIVPMLEN